MNYRRIIKILAVTIILGLISASGSAVAGPARQGVHTADNVYPTISYQGRLTNSAGEPLNGTFNLLFQLYDAPSGGTKIWEQPKNGVQVNDGLFTVELDVDPNHFAGQGLWLAITVNGQLLSPRQELHPAPYALTLRPGATVGNPSGTALYAITAGSYALQGWSSGNIGLLGVSGISFTPPEGMHGVHGIGNVGVYGEGGHTGTYGKGDNDGVKGESTNGNAVHGISSNGYGVLGESTGSAGVRGSSVNGYGGWFSSSNDHYDLVLGGHVGRINTNPNDQDSNLILSSNNDVDIRLDNDSGENGVFRIKNSAGQAVFTVDEQGNFNATGTKSALVQTATHGQRLLYSIESTGVWFEDVGSASLENGQVLVAFDPIFAETVNTDVDYHVFVTPLSEQPVLLFVSAKTANGFTVQGVTLDGQPAECAFDYRIIAKRLGYEQVRLQKAATLQESEP